MDQQQSKFSLSVGTKLLISVVILLLTSIAFLNFSTIFLFKEDKRAYIYQAQSGGAVLAGREFTNTARHALDTLRVSLASVDPTKPVSSNETTALSSIINNQSDLFFVAIELWGVGPGAGQSRTILASTTRQQDALPASPSSESFGVPDSAMRAILPDLQQNGIAFVNLTQPGLPAVLGVLVGDLKGASPAQPTPSPSGSAEPPVSIKIPVAIGLLSLQDFRSALGKFSITVSTKTGWVLFDSDPSVLPVKKNISEDPFFRIAASSITAAGSKEFEADGERYLGSYFRPGFDLVVLSKTQWKKAVSATYALTEKFILLGMMAVSAAMIFAIFFSKTLTAPIKTLYEGTRRVADGDFDFELPVQSRDEIGSLTSSFNVMSKKISTLVQEQIAKARLEDEIKIASTVQQTLIPPEKFENERLLIRSHYRSASQCGGDWWGFFGIGGKFCVMIADATGHGIPSALITASARSCFSVMNKLAQDDPDFTYSPSAMLSYANRVVFDASLGQINMTAFIAVLDLESRVMTYANAGHNPPWLFKEGGPDGKFVLNSLAAPGERLGETRDGTAYVEKTMPIADRDILFLYTDGLTEGKSPPPDETQYGKKRTRMTVENATPKGPDEMIRTLMDDFMRHNGDKALDDDVTVAAIQILRTGGLNPDSTPTDNA